MISDTQRGKSLLIIGNFQVNCKFVLAEAFFLNDITHIV